MSRAATLAAALIAALSSASLAAPGKAKKAPPPAAAKQPATFHQVDNYWIGPLTNPLFGKTPADGDRPDVLIHVAGQPAGPLHLVIYFHGMRNCIQNAAANKGCATPRADPGQSLIAQLDHSGLNAVLVVLQGVYNVSANDLRLAHAARGFFKKFVNDELLPLVQRAMGRTGAAALGKVTLAGHSGAYVPLQKILKDGGLDDKVAGVVLLDSLYAPGGWPGPMQAWHAARADGRLVAVCNDTTGNIDLVIGQLPKGQTTKSTSAGAPASLGAQPYQFIKTPTTHPQIPGKFFGPLLSLLQQAPAAAPPTVAKAAKKPAKKRR